MMEREYQRPEVEVVSLVSEEITTNSDFVDGELGVQSAPSDWN